MTTPIEPFPAHLEARGGDPALVKAELIGRIKDAIRNHPRSLQTRIGPSEVGHPCARRIGYKLHGHPEVNAGAATDTPWLPTIGTAVHAWLEDQFRQANEGHDHARWLVELTLSVGEVLGVDITGHADLYDRVTATVIDWKIVGPTQIKKYRLQGPGDQYRSQIHLYGRGITRRGMPCDTVAIAFLPRNGELADAYIWHEPYDEQVALDALQRAAGIGLTVQNLGPNGLPVLPTADAFCHRCPYFKAGSTDPVQGCAGHPTSKTQPTHDPNAPAFGLITTGGKA